MSCLSNNKVAAYVDGELSVNEARVVAEHLEGCSACQTQSRALQSVTTSLPTLMPAADEAFVHQVMSRLPASKSTRFSMMLTWAAVPVCVLLVLVGWAVGVGSSRPEPVARGAAADPSQVGRYLGVEIFVHPQSQPRARRELVDSQALRPDDGLSFVVNNRLGRDVYLCLFAEDSAKEVTWFYPAYTDAAHPPECILIAKEKAMQQLDMGVTLDRLARGRVSLVALFLSRPAKVTEVESALSRGTLSSMADTLPVLSLQTLFARMSP